VPLIQGGKTIGLIAVGNREGGYRQEELELLEALAPTVVEAFHRKRTEEALLQLSEDMVNRNLELEMVNKELDAFTRSASHDLREPLRIMGGFANIVAEKYADKLDPEGRNYLVRIRSNAERMSQLIEDLLRLSQISRQEMVKINSDLSGIAASVMSGLRQADPDRNVAVVIEKDLRANIDPNLMRIALSNLLINAWKFTSKTEKARIEFGATDQSGHYVYFVRDNGAGFAPEFAGRMFLPFERLHSDKEFGGTGIGLSIAERIIRRHGGRIWAEGEIGKGATFYFTLE
jgi:light-regulated signal transduction histidine kinase (bacteriophytochrome)